MVTNSSEREFVTRVTDLLGELIKIIYNDTKTIGSPARTDANVTEDTHASTTARKDSEYF